MEWGGAGRILSRNPGSLEVDDDWGAAIRVFRETRINNVIGVLQSKVVPIQARPLRFSFSSFRLLSWLFFSLCFRCFYALVDRVMTGLIDKHRR